jgi:branched-chain amino acid transport system substrate-binding protein
MPGLHSKTAGQIIGQLLALIAILGLLPGCAGQSPILVGYAAELTGKRGELGVAGRDGALLAVEEINQNGGINGRWLKLIVKDDMGSPDTARQVDADLVSQGVVAVIGHFTSEQTAAVIESMNRAAVVLLSPTSSSHSFGRQADFFFRVVPCTDFSGKALADHIYNTRGLRRITGVYDENNRAFAQTQWQAIQTEFERLGGDAGQVFTFTSGQTDLQVLMKQIQDTKPEAVVIIASAVDLAFMAQYARQQGLAAPFFSSAWAQTDELLQKGGRAVEGLELVAVYNTTNQYPAFAPFVARFEARFRRQPAFAAAYGYEAVLVLAEALRHTGGTAQGLPAALTGINNFQGVQGLITINEFGDVERDTYIAVVKNGAFHTINTVNSTP